MKISVIVPVYNVEAYLRECLDSLVNQTIDDYEIIAVDDGSTDGSPAILAEYADRFPKLIRIITVENGGQGRARNFGIDEAQGAVTEVLIFELLVGNAGENVLPC